MSFGPDSRQVRRDLRHGVPIRERFAAVLQRLGLSAKEVARQVDRTPRAVERWMAGENDMSVETLVRLCRDFDAVWDEFRLACGRAEDASEAEQLLRDITERLLARKTDAAT